MPPRLDCPLCGCRFSTPLKCREHSGRCTGVPSLSPGDNQKLRKLLTPTTDAVEHQLEVGARGSQRYARSKMIHGLALGGSTAEEGLPERMLPLARGLVSKAFDYDRPMLQDRRWLEALAGAVRQQLAARPAPASVLVLGLGSGLPALLSARAGARVLWVLRVRRLWQVAKQMVEANGLSNAIQLVHRRGPFEQLAGEMDAQFELVVCEDLHAGLTQDAAYTAMPLLAPALLRPGGATIPSSARLWAAAAEVRTTDVAGFDLTLFNRFRNNQATFYDLSDVPHTLLTDRLSVGRLEFSRPTAAAESFAELSVIAPGTLNLLVVWPEIELAPGLTYEPKPVPGGRGFVRRDTAIKQTLSFTGYERPVQPGDTVPIRVQVEPGQPISIQAPLPDGCPAVAFPPQPALAYHFPMIADVGRNSAFNDALCRCLAVRPGSHVLDIGSGSGLLGMMALRAGAGRVTGFEMVEQLATAAGQIVSANGFGPDQMQVLPVKSTECDQLPAGRAAVLVCEILDNCLLGEGVLQSIEHAREHLLLPDAVIIPAKASLWCVAVEMRYGREHGVDLDHLNQLNCDECLAVIGCCSVWDEIWAR